MGLSSTLAKGLAEREGFELGRLLSGISKLRNLIVARVPSDPPNPPYLPPDLPPRQSASAPELRNTAAPTLEFGPRAHFDYVSDIRTSSWSTGRVARSDF